MRLAGKDVELGPVQVCKVCGYTVEGEAPDICPYVMLGKIFLRRLPNKGVIVDIYAYAMQMELDGINYYHHEMSRTFHPGFQRILQLLINQERKHYDIFLSLKHDNKPIEISAFPVKEVRNIFQQLCKSRDEPDFSLPEVELYRKALEIEQKSVDFYREMIEKVENPEVKAQIQQIADEEEKHVILVTELVAFINRPNEWVEHAMFGLREEY